MVGGLIPPVFPIDNILRICNNLRDRQTRSVSVFEEFLGSATVASALHSRQRTVATIVRTQEMLGKLSGDA